MARIAPQGIFTGLDDNGNPISGGKLYTYEAGTTTPKVTYSDAGETTPNTNPVILDSSGRAKVWLEGGAYKFVLDDASDALVFEEDDIIGDTESAFGGTVEEISANKTVNTSENNYLFYATAALTVSLPLSDTGFVVAVVNASSGDVIIDGDGSQTINGSATLTLKPDHSAIVIGDGSNWVSISSSVFDPSEDITFSGDNTFTGNNTFDTGLTVGGDVISTDSVMQYNVEAGEVNSFYDYNFTDISTSQGSFRYFRNTNTTGNLTINVHRGDGTSTTDHIIVPGDTGRVLDMARNGGDTEFNRLGGNGVVKSAGVDIRAIGVAQTLTDVSGSRSGNTVYTNTTGRTIIVIISAFDGSNNPIFEVDGSEVGRSAANRVVFTIPVKDGSTYEMTKAGGGSPTIDNWWELR